MLKKMRKPENKTISMLKKNLLKDEQFIVNFIKYLREKNSPTYSVGFWDSIPEILHPQLKKIIWYWRDKRKYIEQYEDVKINYELNNLFLQDWQHNYHDCDTKQTTKETIVADFKNAHYDIQTWMNPLETISAILRAHKDGRLHEIQELESKLKFQYAELIKDNESHLNFIRSVTYSLSRVLQFYKNVFDVNAQKFQEYYVNYVLRGIDLYPSTAQLEFRAHLINSLHSLANQGRIPVEFKKYTIV